MSVMKAIQQMQDECDMMRASGAFTDEEIDNIVDDFCESFHVPPGKPGGLIGTWWLGRRLEI